MTNQDLFITCIQQLSEEEISALLDATTIMLKNHSIRTKPNCPYCDSQNIIRYGHKYNKERFLCKNCDRTFITITNTVMSNSHFPAEVIEDTLHGNAIDFTANRLVLYHQTIFDIRHKILMAL